MLLKLSEYWLYAIMSRKEDFDNFISEQVTKIVVGLAENIQEPPYFPDSFKQYVKGLLLLKKEEENNDENNNVSV